MEIADRKSKSRELLAKLKLNPRDRFDEFCKVIAGLYPSLFELLQNRNPTREEADYYIGKFSDELCKGIKTSGNRPDNVIDHKVNFDSQFVNVQVVKVNDTKSISEPIRKPGFIAHSIEYQEHTCEINMTEILPQDPSGKVVLVKGRAGSGKSTLSQYLIQKWATGEWQQTFKGSSINDVMQEGGWGGSGPHDQQ